MWVIKGIRYLIIGVYSGFGLSLGVKKVICNFESKRGCFGILESVGSRALGCSLIGSRVLGRKYALLYFFQKYP